MWYPKSGMMKEFIVKYDIQEDGCDRLDPRDNGNVRRFGKERVNNVSGINV